MIHSILSHMLIQIQIFMYFLKRGAYKVKVLKVFDAPQNKEEEKLILEESKNLIQKQLDEWRAEED